MSYGEGDKKEKEIVTRGNPRAQVALWLVKTLWALMMLLLPWVMLEVRPRVIWMDVVFVLWIGSVLWAGWRYRSVLCLTKVVVEYGLLLLFWIDAVLLSGLFVDHAAAYLFEATGLIYLAVLSWTLAYVMGFWLDFRWVKSVLLASLMESVAFGLMGLLLGIFGKWPSAFYNNAYKLTATFKTPNQLAGFLVLFVPWLLTAARRSSRRISQAGYALLLLLVLIELLASGSRTGVGTAFLLFFVEGMYLLLKVGQCGRIRYRAIVGGALAVLLVGTSVWVLRDKIWVINRALSVFQVVASGQVTDSFRLQNWALGLRIFAQYPLTGQGLAQIAAEHPYEIHNTYIAVLAETGIVGAFAFLLLTGYVAYLGWHNVALTRFDPAWNVVARGLFLGLAGELIFASQHMFLRSRPLWFWFALIAAFRVYWIRQRIGRPDSCAA